MVLGDRQQGPRFHRRTEPAHCSWGFLKQRGRHSCWRWELDPHRQWAAQRSSHSALTPSCAHSPGPGQGPPANFLLSLFTAPGARHELCFEFKPSEFQGSPAISSMHWHPKGFSSALLGPMRADTVPDSALEVPHGLPGAPGSQPPTVG